MRKTTRSSQPTHSATLNTAAVRTAVRIRRLLPEPPPLAIVLGSGFDGILGQITAIAQVSYEDLPGFPTPRIQGHAGKLLLGRVQGVLVLLLCGRAHFYEGHTMAEITFPIRVLAELGISTLLLTNAAGGINPRFRPGDFMCLTDHLNFMGVNPLRGQRPSSEAPFLDLSTVYDRALIRQLRAAARQAKVRLHAGVYAAVSGPTYETPAEIRAFAKLGADAVGMSTVPEAIVARQCGLRVAALSCIANRAAGTSREPVSHAEVLAMGKRVQQQSSKLVARFVGLYSLESFRARRSR
ncbi:MAG: purine-nucleoside phosphorylase [Verrucomicrobia bacterium]|nr:purine-nucleoside phosphorylase [Verrucomicrobiota bacterium]